VGFISITIEITDEDLIFIDIYELNLINKVQWVE